MLAERTQAIAEQVVTLAVPTTLGLDGMARFRQATLDTLSNPAVRVLVLRGNGGVFCQGMDLGEISVDYGAAQAPMWEGATKAYAEVLSALCQSQPITVAVVEGAAMGGGVGLAAVCDIVVATDAATFALPELLLGIVPAMILPVLAERLGLPRAKRWALMQSTWKADDAMSAGLVDQVLKKERIDQQLARLVRSLLRSHPRGVAALKGLASEIRAQAPQQAIESGRLCLDSLLGRIETRREIVAFRDFGLLPGEADA